jgi:CRP/FNR family transcriptional regulator, cyclic AMP receptor protein
VRDLLELTAELPRRQLTGGETVIVEGEPTGVLQILESGSLHVRKGDVTVAVLDRPGAVVGEMSVLLGVPPTASVVAATDAVLRVAADGAGFLASRPDIGLLVARMLAERLHLVTTYLADLQQQYGGAGTQLGLVSEVLSSLTEMTGSSPEPGSEREPDPLY